MSLLRFTVVLLSFFTLLPNALHASNILGLFVNGHRSHLLVYTSVVRLLLERGHNITIVTTLGIEGLLIDYDNLHHIQLSLNYTSTEAVDSGANSAGGLDKLNRMMDRIEHSSEFLNDPVLLEFLQGAHKFDLMLLGYLFNDYQLGVAAHFKCPVVIIWTGQPISFVHSLMGNPEERTYVTQPYDRHQYTGLNALAFGLFEKAVELMALQVMERIYEKHFPSSHYPSLTELRSSVSVALCNHHSISEGPIAPYVPGMVDIGGIQNTPKPVELSEHFFNSIRERDLIFLSLGSRVKWSAFPNETIRAFTDAFKYFTNFTILWTYDGDCGLLTKLSSNIMCSEWWPQTAILSHNKTKLFITHGGKGSISEALYHSVPMLGIPIFGDQRANVAKLVNKGFGLGLDIMSLTSQQIIMAVDTLTKNVTIVADIKRYSERYRDRPLTAAESAIFWIEYVIRHKGASHLSSPLRHLNFVQYYLIDIYAAILLIFIAFVLVCNWLERKLDAI